MTTLLQISAAIDRLTAKLGSAVSWAVLAMVMLGAFNALARYSSRFLGVNLSSNAFLEGQWYLFSLVFLFGAAEALRADKHVRVDVLYGRLSKRGKAGINLVGTVLFLVPFCIFGLITTFPWVAESWAVWEVSPDPGGLPRYPIKSALLVAFAWVLIQGLSEIVKALAIVLEPAPEPSDG
ncbi:MAG: TRAP transporter small permease subunit [Proteobacteria bacterium]|nr:TRAP transporter small permease subunit [Pseudomonadota bacterium]